MKIFKLIPLAGMLLPLKALGATALFTLNLQPGDPADSRKSYFYDTEQGSTIVAGYFDYTGAGLAPNWFHIGLGDAVGEIYPGNRVVFSTKELGAALVPGLYTNAMKASYTDPGHPGLDVSFGGRELSELSGSFNISELTYGETGFPGRYELKTLEATFEQQMYFGTWYGFIRYDLTPAPEPTVPFLTCGAILFAGLRRKRREPISAAGHTVSYHSAHGGGCRAAGDGAAGADGGAFGGKESGRMMEGQVPLERGEHPAGPLDFASASLFLSS